MPQRGCLRQVYDFLFTDGFFECLGRHEPSVAKSGKITQLEKCYDLLMSSRSKKLLNKSAPFIGWGLLLIGVLVSIFLPRFSGEIRSRASQEKERTEFPIAVYQRGFSPPYEEFKETGINIFLLDSIYNFDEQKEAIFKVLDEAEKYELKVILNVSVPMQHPVLFPQFEEFLKKVKDHPALYGYYLMDEPELYEFVTAENFRKLNSTIKKYDTKHPTIVVFSNDFDRATKYFGVTDIAGFDIYTYLHNANDQISMETEYSKKLNLFVEIFRIPKRRCTRVRRPLIKEESLKQPRLFLVHLYKLLVLLECWLSPRTIGKSLRNNKV